jgi:cell division transport system permease protein
MKVWLIHHWHSLKLALQRLGEAPFAAAFSILVIGVALSLPVGLYVALNNLQRLAGQTPTDPEITVFLKVSVDEAEARKLADALKARPGVAAVTFISREQGLKSLQEGGLGDLLAGLDNNPLPHALSITPQNADPAAMETLAAEVRKRAEVDRVSLDSDWAKRLTALVRFGTSLVWMLAGLLGLALAAITGNTIRLQIYALRQEIEVSQLIGATDRFIRRPFLYYGALQGLLGGLAGWAMILGARFGLAGHVDQLAAAYGTQFPLHGLGPIETLAMLASAALLGLLGAYLAVNHSLRQLD